MDTTRTSGERDYRMDTMTPVYSRFAAQTKSRARGMLLLLLIVLFLAVATGEIVLYRVAGFLALVIVSSYVCVRLKLWRLDMEMQTKSYAVQVGDTLKWYVYVRNNSPLPTGWVEIALMSSMPGSIPGTATSIGARQQERLEMQVLCHARGVYSIGPLAARAHDPLGLFQVQIMRGKRVKVVVQPRVVPLPNFRLPVAERSGEESVRYRSQSRTLQVATIREYIQGDKLNQIHWLSTARSGQLMSKEFDSGGGGDVWVVLDLERRIHHSQGMDKTDEYGVAVAASLAHLAIREEQAVGLIAYGDREYLLPLNGSSQQMSKILEMLILSRTEGDSSLAEVLVKNEGQFGRSSSLLVVTSSTATEWISVLRELRSRGLNIAVVLVDPASFGGEESLDGAVRELVSAGIPAYVVRRGDHLAHALSRSVAQDGLPIFTQFGNRGRIRASSISRDGDESPEVTRAGT